MTGLRIVHAVRSDGFAGVERYVAQLAVAQAAAGHHVVVIGGEPIMMRSLLASAGIRNRPAATVAETARAIDAERHCDVLQVHMTAAETAAMVAVRAWRVPVVSTRHFPLPRGGSLPGRFVGRLVARRIATQIAISHYTAERIEGPSTVVHTGVPDAPDAVPAAGREPSVLVAQRLEPEKRTDDAVRAFAAARLAQTGWHLDIAGAGSRREALESLARELKVAQAVRFLGQRPDVPDLMRSAGIVLATCDIEGLGLSVLEAMAAGTPVVAVAAGGHLETIGGVPGASLYSRGNTIQAGERLARLASDPTLRDRYGAQLQSRQRTAFTIAAQALATEAVYRSVL